MQAQSELVLYHLSRALLSQIYPNVTDCPHTHVLLIPSGISLLAEWLQENQEYIQYILGSPPILPHLVGHRNTNVSTLIECLILILPTGKVTSTLLETFWLSIQCPTAPGYVFSVQLERVPYSMRGNSETFLEKWNVLLTFFYTTDMDMTFS